MPVSDLLGSDIPKEASSDKYDEIAKQLAVFNEQMANKEKNSARRWGILKKVLLTILLIIFLMIIVTIIAITFYKADGSNGGGPSYETGEILNQG